MRFLVFTTDMVPLPGVPTSGTALRTHGLIQGLRAHGHEVIVSVPTMAVQGFLKSNDPESFSPEIRRQLDTYKLTSFHPENQANLFAEIAPDVILCGHWPAMMLRTKPSQMLVVDLAGPHLLERHYQGSGETEAVTLAKLGVLATADYFIVSGPSQRLYFLSFLLRANVPSPEKRIVEIAMPLDPKLPAHAGGSGDYPRFVFGGVFLPWQDPSWGIRNLGALLREKGKGKLSLIGGSHPNYRINTGQYEDLFREMAENPQVDTKPMLPLETFTAELSRSDVALDVMGWNLERQLAMTIRSTTYLWAGVPVIYNDYADLGKLIQRFDAGWCVAPGDDVALKNVIEEIYSSPEVVKRKSANAQRLAREVFAWDHAVQKLLSLLGSTQVRRNREIDIIVDVPQNADFPVSSAGNVGQYFLCRASGLSRIECRIATHEKEIQSPVDVRVYEVSHGDNFEGLRGGSGGRFLASQRKQLLGEVQVEASVLKNNQWIGIDLEPIPDSAGKAYYFEIVSRNRPEENSISPWAVKASPYPMFGLSYKDNVIDDMCLCMRTVCAWLGNNSH